MVIYDDEPEVLEAAWLKESRRRLESVRARHMKTIPADEVERRLWELLERTRDAKV